MQKFILLFFTVLLFQCVSAFNSEKPVPLFNGKNLSGWKQLNGKAKYEVKNGEIVGTTVQGEPNSFLVTEKYYGDFVLEIELKVDSPMNSGIQIRSESREDYMNGKVHGYQVEIDPSPRAWSGGLYDEARRGWLYTMEYNPAAKKAFKNGAWNKYRIECIGNNIRTWVNGIPAAWVYDGLTPKGFIALQVHSIGRNEQPGRQIRWRNIMIQTNDLKPSPSSPIFIANAMPNQLSPEEINRGYRLLWDGVTTKGWKGAYLSSFPGKGWQINDGTLQVMPDAGKEAANGGDIVTTELFGAFELQFEFKLTDSANSGVKYFVTEKENNPGSAIGLEYQLLDDAAHPDAKMGVVGNRKMGSLYDLIPALQFPAMRKKIGDWNTGRIIVYPDNRIEHWLNGYKVVEYQRGTPVYFALVARSKYEKWPDFGMAPKGRILLQDHGNQVSFRSIKIRELN